MKIVTIDGLAFPPEPDEWPKKVMDEYLSADIVIYTFTPFSHYIMKAPSGVKVTDIRQGMFRKYEIMSGSGNPRVCELQAEKMKARRNRRKKSGV